MRVINQIINQYTTPEQRKALKNASARTKAKITTTILKTLPPLASDLYTHIATTGTALKSGNDKVIKNQIKDLATDAAVNAVGLVGLKGIDKVVKPISKARIAAVKMNPKAAETIKRGVEAFKKPQQGSVQALDDLLNEVKKQGLKIEKATEKGGMDVLEFFEKYGLPNNKLLTDSKMATKAINKAEKSGIGSLSSKETDSIMEMLKGNTKQLGDLAKEVGVKSKKDIPDLMKFVNQLGDIIKNSPNYIKSAATNKDQITGLIANSGLSIYDLYQAYKKNNGSLLPKSLSNVARIGAGLIPGNPILKIFYGGLGYTAGDRLSSAAFAKLGVKHETSDIINKEIEAGIYQPGLSDEIPEFIEGQSGRKYHVTGNKIFDYATGRPVNIASALEDASNFVQFKTQEAIDKKNALEQQENDLRIAMQQGYNIDPGQIQNIQVQKEAVQQEINHNSQLANQLQPLTYDPQGDLVEQYRQNVVAPEQQRQEQKSMFDAQQLQNEITTAYSVIGQKIAADSAADIERFINPTTMRNDYYLHQVAARQGKAFYYNNIDEYVEYRRAKAMAEIQPQIRQQAATIMQNNIKSQQDLREFLLDVQKFEEDARHNRAGEAVDIYNAQTDRGYKQGQLDIGQYNAQTGRINAGINQYEAQTGRINAATNRSELGIKGYNAETGRMNANTAAKDVERKQQLLPYQQASYAGQTVMNAGMSGLSMDQFLNSNTSVFGQVFPGTQQVQATGKPGDGTVPYVQYKNQINQYYNQQ